MVQLQEKEKQLVESRAAVLRLQEELSLTQSQLSDARCKLELYSERKNPSKPSRRENEQVCVCVCARVCVQYDTSHFCCRL